MKKKSDIKFPRTKYREILIKDLVRLVIFETGEFKLKHHEIGPTIAKSPFKINLRTRENRGPLIPDAVRAIGEEIFNHIKEKKIKFDLVAGVPQTGESFAKIVSELSGKPLLKLKKEVIGDKRKITDIAEGKFSPGQTVLLIDDVITFGYSLEEAILVLKKAELKASNAVVFIDRCQGGRERIANIGCNVYYVFGIIYILYICQSIGRITYQQNDEITRYINSNKV